MLIGALAVTAFAAGTIHFGVPRISRAIETHRLKRLCLDSRSLILTFDDGPGKELTPRVLDLLDLHGVKATFFLLGRQVTPCAAITTRIKFDGHEIACHGQDHLHAWKVWPWRAVADIKEGYQTLAPWARSDAMFRPPYGKLCLPTWLYVRKRGARFGWWTIDSGDTHRRLPDPQAIADRAAREGGAVVLMHDFDRQAKRQDFVLRTTELLIQTAKREGLTICRLCDLRAGATFSARSNASDA